MKKILVPVDFSPVSDYAFELATHLAKDTGASVEVIHIVHAPGETLFDKNGELLECTEFDVTPLREEAHSTALRLKEWIAAKSFPVASTVKIGNFYETLLKVSEEGNYDLVVTGAEHVHGLKQSIKGTLADKFIRKTDVPVLTVKCDRSQLAVRKILLAGDFRSPQKENLSVLNTLISTYNAELHLVKVNTQKDFETERQVLERMKKFIELNDLQNAHIHIYNDRSVEEGIVHFCEDYQMDVLAIGTHGRSDFSHLFRGSKAEDVVNHIFKPILTFKI